MATRTISTKLAIDGESAYRASLSRINAEIKSLQSALKLTESQYQTNANSMAALTAKGEALSALYKSQESKVKELRSALENAKKAEKEYADQKATLIAKIQANNQALEALKNTTGDTSEEQAKLTAENKELSKQLETCDANLAAAEKGANSWQTQLNSAEIKLNNLDAELKLNDEYMDEAKESTDGCATSIDRFGDRADSAADKADALTDALAAAGVIVALRKTADALEGCVDASVEFESAMAGVAKTTDLSSDELERLGDSFKAMSTEMPITATELANIAEVAGQLGVSSQNLESFTTVMAELATATNMTSEEAATMIAQFAAITGMDLANVDKLGASIVALGNNFATNEQRITEMAQSIAGAATNAGMAETDMLALSTAVTSLGIEAGTGGTNMSKLISEMQNAVQTGEKLDTWAEAAGMTASEFSQLWGQDATSAILAFVQGLGSMGGEMNTVLNELGIGEEHFKRMVTSLANAEQSSGMLTKAITLSSEAWDENSALVNEASTRYETTESKLTMLSNAYGNVGTAIGDKLTPAVGELADAGTEVLTWAAAFIEDSDMLVPMVTAAATAIGTLAAGFVTYAAVTKLATTAMGLFTAVLDTNPIFLAITAIAALAAGIGVLVATIEDDAVPSVKELTTVAQELPEAFESANATYEESETQVLATAAAAQKYIDRLKDLEAQGTLTEAQQTEYAQIVDILRTLLPDVNIELDEQTKLLVGGTSALESQVAGWKELALQEALTTKYNDQIKAWSDAELEVYENQVKLIQAEEEEETIAERLNEIRQEMTDICEEQNSVMADSTLTLVEQREKYDELQQQLLSLNSEMIDLQDQQDTNKETQENLTQAIEDGTEITGQYEQQVTDAYAALEEFKAAEEETASGTGELSDSLTQNQQTIQALQTELTSLAEAYSTAYQSAYESIDGQIGLFDTFAASISADTDTVEEMIERWAEQTANLGAYTENLQKAAQYGLDDGLVTSLSDGSTESAGYLATIIEKIEELGGSTEGMSTEAADFVSEFNAAFASTEEAKESFAATVAAIETDLDKAIEAMEASAAEVDFSGFGAAVESAFADINVDFESIGLNVGAGLSAGIDGSTGEAAASATALGEAVSDATAGSLGEHSPSTVFREIGENADLGLQQGIDAKVATVVSSVESMGQKITQQMQQSARKAVDSYDQQFSQVVNRTRTICNSLCATVTSATSGMPGTMSNIGAQMVNGMISGLNSRSGSLYSTISSIVNSAISRARRAAAVRSPSKKTTEIFEYVGEGMVVGLENKRKKISDTAQSVVDDALNVDVSGKLKSTIGSISSEIPAGLSAIISGGSAGQAVSGGNVEVTINISRFENNSDKDLDQIVEYVQDSLQQKISKKEAALA